jgi:hypothetical protein
MAFKNLKNYPASQLLTSEVVWIQNGHSGILVEPQVTTPSNPASGYNKLYFKSDNNLYKLDASGTETLVGGGTWGSITGTLSNQTDLQAALDAKVPYTGATADVHLGAAFTLYVATITSEPAGGLNITGPIGGDVNISAAQGVPTGPGGLLSLSAGDAATNGTDGGNVEFYTGKGASGYKNGVFKFYDAANDWNYGGILDFSLISTSDKTFTFPDLSGTFALMGVSQTTDFTTTGLGTFGSLVVNTSNLVVNASGYANKIGFGTATPANTWEFSDPTPGGTFAGIGMLLRNPTDVSASPTFRLSPALILSAQGKGATNQQYQWAQYMTPSGSADSLTFKFAYKFGAGAWTDHPFYLDNANGFVISCAGVGESIRVVPKVFYLLNSTAATSSLDQYTGPILWVSQGWKTQATAASQYMAMSQLNAPEQGTISPIGVHKWMYGINTNIPVEANELMRLQWGSDAGVTGVFFNKRSLTSYTFNVTGLPVYANNAAAVAGGLAVGSFYRTGGDPDNVCVVH